MGAAELVDSLISEPVVVFGSLPPQGRDLDVLARPTAMFELSSGLPGHGFRARGSEWVRFAGCDVQAIDLVAAESWDLPAGERSDLFAQAWAIEGHARLLRPAPAHVLLILARRRARDGALAPKHHARIATALADDDGAWTLAARRAHAWEAESALADLRRVHQSGETGGGRRSLRRRLRGRRRGMLVTLSGLDGSGKSTQAEALQVALQRLGYPSVVVWTSVTAHGSLPLVAAPAKALLRLAGRLRSGSRANAGAPHAGAHADDPARELRQRSRLLTFGWTMFVALTNAWWQSRATRPHLLRGRVVICDRYTLDSKVHMRFSYGDRRTYRAQMLMVRLLSPRPRLAYLLDVSPGTIHRRNQEYTPEQIARRTRFYREEHAHLGVRRLDGELPREELCARIASEVWDALA
jgi:thymidylate kinase